MKIQIFSDLHLENKEIRYPVPYCETLILAGDICEVDKLEDNRAFFLYISMNWNKILWIPGNHEYYSENYNMDEIDSILELFVKLFPNIIMLNRKSVTIDNIKFMGCTLWSNIHDDVVDRASSAFTKLLHNNFPINNIYYNNLNDRDIKWIYDNYNPSNNTVLITHFPIKQEFTTNPDYKNDSNIIKNVYTNNIDISPCKDKFLYCISGHTHYNFNKKIGNITFLSNQYGYNKNPEDNFNEEGLFIL